ESRRSYWRVQVALEDHSSAHRVFGSLVTGNYFESLGIRPALGRFFTRAEDVHVGASPYAVLSYSCWQNRFAADPQIAGKIVHVNGRPYTVLGVAPRGFHGTEQFFWAESWLPMTMQPQIEGNSWLEFRGVFNAWIAGRLKPGVSVAQAEANLKTVAMQLSREYPANDGMQLTLSIP